MIDLIVDKIVDCIDGELGQDSEIYTDYLAQSVSSDNLMPNSPDISIAVLEQDSVPTEYRICDRISHTAESYNLEIQTLIRAAKQQDAKKARRSVTQRVKHCLMKKNGSLFTGLLTLVDSGVGYRETVRDYKITRTDYDSAEVRGNWLYLSSVAIVVNTSVDYYD